MERLQKFLRTYLIIAILYALLGVLDSILQLIKYVTPMYTGLLSFMTFLFFLFNIVALVVLYKSNQERITLVLPVYHLALFLFFFLFGIVTASLAIKENLFFGIAIFGLISSLAELGFGYYVLRKFRFI